MTLASAYEDFRQSTLGVLPGLWARLCYVAGLRGSGGDYRHWGMARTYGSHASQKAVAAAHSELFLAVLRTPLRQIGSEFQAVEKSSEPLDWALCVPADMGGGSAAHFNSIVSALQALAETPRS